MPRWWRLLDDNVGRVAIIWRKNLLDNTLVVYTSDQGSTWVSTVVWQTLYMKNPCVLHWLCVCQKGFDRKEILPKMVQNIDYAPTFLELAGVPVPEDIHGVSLLPLLKGEHPRTGAMHCIIIFMVSCRTYGETSLWCAYRPLRWIHFYNWYVDCLGTWLTGVRSDGNVIFTDGWICPW